MKAVLIKSLKRAGEIQLKKFQNIDKISIKETISSIVTEVDFESERAIIEIIQKEFPKHNILSEETGLKNNNSRYTWIIDPLDGTSNYAAGLPWFGVLIAVFQDKVPFIAGAYIPITDKLYLAESGKGAFMNGQILKINPKKIEDSLVGFSTDHSIDENYLRRGLEIYKYVIQNARNVRSTNCLIDLLNVTENNYGCSVNMFNGIWDIAAPYLIIKEAGGIMKDISGKEIEFKLDENNIKKNYSMVTGSELLVNKLVKEIQN